MLADVSTAYTEVGKVSPVEMGWLPFPSLPLPAVKLLPAPAPLAALMRFAAAPAAAVTLAANGETVCPCVTTR